MEIEPDKPESQPVPQGSPATYAQPAPLPEPVAQAPAQQPQYQAPPAPQPQYTAQPQTGPMAIQYRNPILWAALFFVPFVNFIVLLYWIYKTSEEIKSLGGQIPTIILVFLPIVSIYFLYKYAVEYARCVLRKDEWIVPFLMFFFPPIAIYVIQTELNKLAQKPA